MKPMEFEAIRVEDIVTHWHHVPALDGGFICIDVTHYNGEILAAHWFGRKSTDTGYKSFTGHDGQLGA